MKRQIRILWKRRSSYKPAVVKHSPRLMAAIDSVLKRSIEQFWAEFIDFEITRVRSYLLMYMKKLRASDRLKTSAFSCNTSVKL